MVMSAVMGAFGITLPIVFHMVGLGSKFLPMLLPIMLNGFLSLLPWAALTGALVPVASGLLAGILVPDLLNLHRSATCLVEFDLAEEMLRVNSAKFPGAIIGRVCADAQTMPFSDECFDLAVCFSALPHMPDKSAALRQILRVLRPGGVFCVGHLMGSRELNAFHSSLEGPVAVDILPPAAALARIAMVFQNPEDQLFMPALLDDVALPLVNRGLQIFVAQRMALDRLDKLRAW